MNALEQDEKIAEGTALEILISPMANEMYS